MRSESESSGARAYAADARENRSYCKAAFDSLHVAIGGAVKPCCIFEGNIGDVSDSTFEDVWTGAKLRQLRAKMLRDERDTGCRKCYQMEDAGGHSLRQDINGDAPHDGLCANDEALLKKLDIRLSSLCNLKCRTCGPDYSSKWHGDAQKLGWKTGASALKETFGPERPVLAALGALLDTVEEFLFAGGEPLIHAEHYAILEELIRRRRTDVGLSYISNMTELRLGRRDILALWSKFDHVDLTVSIDGHEKIGELVRDGISWERFTKNVATVRRICPHVQMQFNITVSVFNIHSLPALCESLRAVEGAADLPCLFNIVQDPVEYSIQILPPDMKAKVRSSLEAFALSYAGTPRQSRLAMADQVQSVVNFMTFQDRSEKIKRFRDHTLRIDRIRDQDTAAVIPEIAPLLRVSALEGVLTKARESKTTILRWAAKAANAKA